jgi:hypothetical protein
MTGNVRRAFGIGIVVGISVVALAALVVARWPASSLTTTTQAIAAAPAAQTTADEKEAAEGPQAAPKEAAQKDGVAKEAAEKEAAEKEAAAEPLFHDIHFHLTNYLQEGIDTNRMLDIMGGRVGRVALFGIPLLQKWDPFLNGERRPKYYLETGAELYYYSFIDAMIARQYLRLKEKDRERFDPFIVGFNPTDMNGKEHIRNVLLTFPGVFVGIGEFSIHKELVTPKVTGHAASLLNPAVGSILEFAAETGLLVVLHCDIDEIRPTPDRPAHLDDLKRLFAKHPRASIIYAHTGLGRFVGPSKNHVGFLREIVADPALSHVSLDISWDEVAKWVVRDAESTKAWAELINEYPDRFLFGTDSVAPQSVEGYLKCYMDYEPLWNLLTPAASRAVRLGNYERLVNTARPKVRAWEDKNLADDDEPIIIPFPKPGEKTKAAAAR